MAREKEGYRDHLSFMTQKIEAKYPESQGMLTVAQVADFLDCNVKTVLNNINRRYNPLPAVNIAVGRKVWRISVTELARWSLG